MHILFRSSLADILCGGALIAIGVLILVYREEIGSLTGYSVGRGGHVDKPTPGWMLIPFALALLVLGLVVIVRSLWGW